MSVCPSSNDAGKALAGGLCRWVSLASAVFCKYVALPASLAVVRVASGLFSGPSSQASTFLFAPRCRLCRLLSVWLSVCAWARIGRHNSAALDRHNRRLGSSFRFLARSSLQCTPPFQCCLCSNPLLFLSLFSSLCLVHHLHPHSCAALPRWTTPNPLIKRVFHAFVCP